MHQDGGSGSCSLWCWNEGIIVCCNVGVHYRMNSASGWVLYIIEEADLTMKTEVATVSESLLVLDAECHCLNMVSQYLQRALEALFLNHALFFSWCAES